MLAVGDSVVVVGLNGRPEFNNHVGKVVKEAVNGRLGVQLHGVVWNCDDSAGQERVLVRLENLRRVIPPAGYPKLFSSMGTVPPACILRLMGSWGLPDGLGEHVSQFLSLPAVEREEIQVCGCSSTRGDFPLASVLKDDDSKWWISANNSFPDGKGRECLDFHFGKKKRVCFMGIKIPPLPYGPLSVRDFHVLVCTSTSANLSAKAQEDPGWTEHPTHGSMSPLHTTNQAEMQEIALSPPVDAVALRLVLTKNAEAASVEGDDGAGLGASSVCESVGLFQVCFA